MREYLTNLISEKGITPTTEIDNLMHEAYGEVIGLTWVDLIEFISNAMEYHEQIRKTLLEIDFAGGDVFHYLRHLAYGMVSSTEIV